MDIFGLLGSWLSILIIGGFIVFMNQKKGWKWQQILSGVLLLGVLYGNFPNLPASINNGVTNIVQSFQK